MIIVLNLVDPDINKLVSALKCMVKCFEMGKVLNVLYICVYMHYISNHPFASNVAPAIFQTPDFVRTNLIGQLRKLGKSLLDNSRLCILASKNFRIFMIGRL